MIRPSPRLDELERSHSKKLSARTYSDALAIFAGLWREAAALNPGFPGDWREDLAPDLAIARAVNGLPPDS
ncbi:MAG TPA: hypothetical protein VEY33_14275 [Gemmatimonadota bacterium]|nr:hypothetical protein [Gemmatimonadota bacterium]